jgi:KaiC/GvpD/RAD55 family RecA-like ATPase
LPSGVEPVDMLLGGLKAGKLYLTWGEATSSNFFIARFLVEGLKRKERALLIINYPPEIAIWRMAHLGYDCMEDIRAGRFILLEYAETLQGLEDITQALIELQSLVAAAQPSRLAFDPISGLISAGREEEQARQFASWAQQLNSITVISLEAGQQNLASIFKPLVEESFRFELRGNHRILSLENSPETPPQIIEVVPHHGIFLLGEARTQ